MKVGHFVASGFEFEDHTLAFVTAPMMSFWVSRIHLTPDMRREIVQVLSKEDQASLNDGRIKIFWKSSTAVHPSNMMHWQIIRDGNEMNVYLESKLAWALFRFFKEG